ncbi:hypothetical protein [Cystobacter fuscus]
MQCGTDFPMERASSGCAAGRTGLLPGYPPKQVAGLVAEMNVSVDMP